MTEKKVVHDEATDEHADKPAKPAKPAAPQTEEERLDELYRLQRESQTAPSQFPHPTQ